MPHVTCSWAKQPGRSRPIDVFHSAKQLHDATGVISSGNGSNDIDSSAAPDAVQEARQREVELLELVRELVVRRRLRLARHKL